MNIHELFSKDEMLLLGQYANINRIEGVPFSDFELGVAKLGLINKGLLNKNGELQENLIVYVEILKRYCKAKKYFAVQDYFFALEEDDSCIILKFFEQDNLYSFSLGNYGALLGILAQHPLIQRNIIDLINENFPEEIQERNEIPKCYLLMELIDNSGKVLKYKYIFYEEEKHYYINLSGNVASKVEDNNYLRMVLSWLPELKIQMEDIAKGVEKDGRWNLFK